MFVFVILCCLSLFVVISTYLLIYSPYRIRNWHGFVVLFLTFTPRLLFIWIFPFCQLYLLYFLLFIDIHSFRCFYHSIIIFYCVIESLFFLFIVEQARFLNNRPLPKRALLPKNYDEQFLDGILNAYEKSEEDFRVCFGGWFYTIKDSSWDLIYEDNILACIAMSTYGVKYWDEMTNEQQEHIKRLYNRLLNKCPEQRSKIKSGYNDRIRMRHPYRDTIKYTHYPMFKYVFFAFIRNVGIIVLKSMGYEHIIIDNVSFYVRKYSRKTRSPPILFLHGLSPGLNVYILFIHRLTSLDRTIILLDVPYASMRIHTEVLPISTVLSSIEQLLISLDEKQLATIGHSYGTLIQASIIKQMPHIVFDQPVIFLDPVCFLIFDARYCENFIHRKPRTPNQFLLHAFCTEDLYLAYALERHICWYECNLWPEDIKRSHSRIHVFIAENDDIIPVPFVYDYLRKSNIETTMFHQFKHAQLLMTPHYQDHVLDVLNQLEMNRVTDDDSDDESVYF